MRIAPPGRTSSSQTGVVKCLGPHHCAMCFGSVHASNTSSRGALMIRVRVSSCWGVSRPVPSEGDANAGVFVLLWVGVISLLLLFLLKLAKVVLQAVEAPLPKVAVLICPTCNLSDRERVEVVPLFTADSERPHETGSFEDAQVLRSAKAAHGEV